MCMKMNVQPNKCAWNWCTFIMRWDMCMRYVQTGFHAHLFLHFSCTYCKFLHAHASCMHISYTPGLDPHVHSIILMHIPSMYVQGFLQTRMLFTLQLLFFEREYHTHTSLVCARLSHVHSGRSYMHIPHAHTEDRTVKSPLLAHVFWKNKSMHIPFWYVHS